MPISVRWCFSSLLLFCCVLATAFSAHAQSERRVAFVIGNEAYQAPELPRLYNPALDVDLMTRTLEGMGFEVWPKEKRVNLTLSEMERQRKIFNAAARGAAVGLVYYAGHGMQDAGKNYLFPIDAKPTDFFELQRQSIGLDEMMDSLAYVTQLRIGLFDSCRDNQMVEALRASDPTRAPMMNRGMAPVQLESGAVRNLIAFPTKMGAVTTDGVSGQNSPFVRALARRLPQQEGLRSVLGYVTDDVAQETRNARLPQRPETISDIGGEDFFLMGRPPGGAPLLVDPAQKALCEEASHPDDPNRPAGVAGTLLEVLQPDRHLAACQTWAWSAPRDERPWAILARLHSKAKRGREALEAAQRGADLGDPEAMVMMGVIYEESYPDVPQDYAQAANWCRKAADLGYARGLHCLGWLHEDGHGFPKDEAQAAAWYRKAAEAGNPSGMRNLGWIYENGWGGVLQDHAQALHWYRKAVEAGSARGMNSLGAIYREGRGVPKDDNQATALYRKAAEAGYAESMCHLGWAYANGRGAPQDDETAVEWYRKSAAAGHSGGMYNLGWMYENGRGVPPSDEQAISWYQKAAEAGHGNAMATLGWIYEEGRDSLPKDETQAVEWFRKAAEAGNGRGMQALGWRYANGRSGLPQNDEKAVEWYQKAAEAGNAAGMNSLGLMYAHGRGGLPQDDVKAVEWYQKAAEAGDAWGMHNLAWRYRKGSGDLPKDEAKALDWFHKSAEAGNLDAMDRIGKMQGWENEDKARASYSQAAATAAEDKDIETLLSIARRYEQGDGVAQDYGRAMDLYQKAVALGSAQAMSRIGRIYMNGGGEGLPSNIWEALEWYKKAANAGDLGAMFTIGQIHEDGGWDRLPPNIWEALEWYQKAANAGDPRSMSHIGDLFLMGPSSDDGHGLPKNLREAARWYKRAAEAGDVRSMLFLGMAQTDGFSLLQSMNAATGNLAPDDEVRLLYQQLRESGVARDDAQARLWFEKAAASKNEDLATSDVEEILMAFNVEELKEQAQAALKALETLPPEAPSRAAQPPVDGGGAATSAPAALGTLGGVVSGVIGDQIGRYLLRQDLIYAQNAVLQSLEAQAPINWRNPETGARGAFSPTLYFNDQYGRLCANYQHQIYLADGRSFTDDGVMCDQENVGWRIQQAQ